MNRFLSLVLLLALASGASAQQVGMLVKDSNWRAEVRSVTLYRSGIDQEPPVLLWGTSDRLMLRFDVLGDEPQMYRYHLRHCDADWRVDDMDPTEFQTGLESEPVDNYDPSFTTLQPFNHYYETVPSRYTNFLISGNYALFVTLADDPDSIIFTRRFWVTEQSVDAQIAVTRPTTAGQLQRDQEVAVTINRAAEQLPFDLPPVTLNQEYYTVQVQQNGRIDNQRFLPFSSYSNGSLCYRWNEANVFPGGNSFRYFDLSNLRSSAYRVMRVESFGGETFAIIRPDEDRHDKHYSVESGINGGFKVNIVDRSDKNLEADYLYVNLSLPMERPFLDGSVHLVGDFTQWLLNDESRMEWNPEYKAYTARLFLKQGFYSYQILFQPASGGEALTSRIEGDHYETPNIYTLRVYYRAPGDRYCRLLSVRRGSY